VDEGFGVEVEGSEEGDSASEVSEDEDSEKDMRSTADILGGLSQNLVIFFGVEMGGGADEELIEITDFDFRLRRSPGEETMDPLGFAFSCGLTPR
jgi:hypothetical protein